MDKNESPDIVTLTVIEANGSTYNKIVTYKEFDKLCEGA